MFVLYRETSDLVFCVADLQLNNQKLQEEVRKLKQAVENMEDTNQKLIEENEDLKAQAKMYRLCLFSLPVKAQILSSSSILICIKCFKTFTFSLPSLISDPAGGSSYYRRRRCLKRKLRRWSSAWPLQKRVELRPQLKESRWWGTRPSLLIDSSSDVNKPCYETHRFLKLMQTDNACNKMASNIT